MVSREPMVLDLRRRLVEEEAREFAEALGYHAPPWRQIYRRGDGEENTVGEGAPLPVTEAGLADAATDLAYVSLGTLIHLWGEGAARRVWNEVQRSNLAKFGPGAWQDEHGKVRKPPDWTPPDIARALASK